MEYVKLIVATMTLLLVGRGSAEASEPYCLQRGDVITHVNTLDIHRIKDFWKAIKHSEQTMYLTVQTTNGAKKVLHVQLNQHKNGAVARFGADVGSNQLQGVKVTHVRRNSPATRCQVAN
ncbi:MAG: hypothetical protein CMM03_15800 [Rhodopirellula sp.]|nr:hypothetical protein [Rhodopirellula sp.]|tara:strand:- start:168 stop:527 length:360 start_codon:yes stop_codon:yes gene_type:complete